MFGTLHVVLAQVGEANPARDSEDTLSIELLSELI